MIENFEALAVVVEDQEPTREPTRDEAILHIVGNLTTLAIAEGAQLAQIVGPDAAATLTVLATRDNARALAVLGVTIDDVRAAIESRD